MRDFVFSVSSTAIYYRYTGKFGRKLSKLKCTRENH